MSASGLVGRTGADDETTFPGDLVAIKLLCEANAPISLLSLLSSNGTSSKGLEKSLSLSLALLSASTASPRQPNVLEAWILDVSAGTLIFLGCAVLPEDIVKVFCDCCCCCCCCGGNADVKNDSEEGSDGA